MEYIISNKKHDSNKEINTQKIKLKKVMHTSLYPLTKIIVTKSDFNYIDKQPR